MTARPYPIESNLGKQVDNFNLLQKVLDMIKINIRLQIIISNQDIKM